MKPKIKEALLIVFILLAVIDINSVNAADWQVVPIDSYDEFRSHVLYKSYDVDGNGIWCYDAPAILWKRLGLSLYTGGYKVCDATGSKCYEGCVRGCWELMKNENAGSQFTLITNKADVRRGDIVVLVGKGDLIYQCGHIGFADNDYNQNGPNYILNQQAKKAFSVDKVSTNVYQFLGAFRYKGWSELKGNLDSASGTDDGQIRIYGWAYDPTSLDTNLNLRVNATTDGLYWETKNVEVNNFQRDDLDYTKKGFLISIPTDLRGDKIYITVVAEGNGKSKSLISGDGFKTLNKPVTADYPREIKLNHSTLDLEYKSSNGSIVSTSGTLSVLSTQPGDAKNKNIIWTSSDTNVAVVSPNGLVTPNNYGTAIITATVDGKPNVKAECKVTVSAPNVILPSSITLNKSNEVLEINDQLALSVTVLPDNAEDKTIAWSSSDTGVATVSNGVVRAVGEGSAVITASANADSSIKKTCTITVVKQAEESCDWAEKSYLPPNVNSDGWEIEVKNHYSQVSTSSPGSGWTQTGSSTRYVVSGEPYTTYRDLGETSTRRFLGNVWYHWCGYEGHSDWVELENAAGYWQYHENAIGSGLEDRAQYEDSNIKGVYQHELWWTAGQYAGHLAHCGLGGQRWYYGWKYQDYSAITDYTWERDSEWLSLDQLDSNATSVSYRFRLKNCDAVSYTVTFKVANGSWDDGTTADKTVTLDGIASDTLTLSEEQIPTAGTKPNTNYKTGKWGLTPSVNTQITGDTTYTYTYAKKDSLSSTVTFKVVNGAWDDETTADKTVTLSGYEGDELKLSAADIPAVGTKPNNNYKAGSWDIIPDTNNAISTDTTYIYTYAADTAVTSDVKLIVSAEEAYPGKKLTLSVSIENNPGIIGMELSVKYDESRLSFEGFEDSGLTGWEADGAVLLWLGEQDTKYNGEILKLKFTVLKTAAQGEAAVTVSCADGMGDFELNAYHPDIQSGKVTVSYLPGDLTGDGTVNIFDLILLKKYILNKNTVIYSNPDTTGDGNVNIFDLILLKKYILNKNIVIH